MDHLPHAQARPDATVIRAPVGRGQSQDPRWRVLGDLVRARRFLPLNKGDICVLRALLSCMQGTMTVVFASNATLVSRSNGMPERTLARHLSRLVEHGFICRKDSGNRKRFARRDTGGIVDAFGLDLAPLFARATGLAEAARQADADDLAVARFRDRLSGLRAALEAGGLAADLVREIRLERRRSPCLSALQALIDQASAHLGRSSDTEEMADSDSQIGSHQQSQDERQSSGALPSCNLQPAKTAPSDRNLDAKTGGGDKPLPMGPNAVPRLAAANSVLKQVRWALHPRRTAPTDDQRPAVTSQPRSKAPPHKYQSASSEGAIPSLDEVLDACPEAVSLSPERPSTWSQLFEAAWQVGRWIGIPDTLMADAAARLGRDGLAVTLFCLCQRHREIRAPAGYLRSLVARPGFWPAELLPKTQNRALPS